MNPEDSSQPVLAFEAFELDRARFELRSSGQRVHMEPQVFEVLAWLVANHDRLVTKQELLDHVWPESYITEAALNSRLMAARKAIGDSGREQRLIKTVHGRGFRFVGEVHTVAANLPVPARRPPVTPLASAPIAGAGLVIGREQELEALSGLLVNPACRLLTITGPGGVGKTRLINELVRRERLAGKELAYVSLESAEDSSELPWLIAAALGRHLQHDGSVAELVQRLGAHSYCVVLDNFEHLLPAGALLVGELLASAPGLRLIVTTRAVLGIQEEWLFTLGGLALDAQPGMTPPAVELFRARSLRAGAAATDGDDAAVLEVCRLVDGMPLAIELAAGLARFVRLDELAESIRRDISVLRTGLRDVPERHRSIPGLFEESVRRLTVHQIGALLACSIFEGEFSRESAMAVADTDFAMLSALADLSLVQVRGGRFSMHPLLRQFARSRLSGAEDRLRERHATHYTGFLSSRTLDLQGRHQLDAVEEIEPELPNILAAWRWSVGQRRFDLLDVSAAPLMLYCVFHARFHEANEASSAAIAALDSVEGYDELRLYLVVSRAWTCIRGGPHAEVPALVRLSRALIAESPNAVRPGILSDPRALWSMLRTVRGDYRGAYRFAMDLVAATEGTADLNNHAAGLWMAASAAFRACEFDWVTNDPAVPYSWNGHCVELPGEFSIAQVRDLLARAESALDQTGDRWLRSNLEIELGLVTELDDRAASTAHFERACELREAFNDRDGLAVATVYLAGSVLESGDPTRAAELLDLAEDLIADLGDAGQQVEISRARALVASYIGRRIESFLLFEESVEGSLRLGFVNNVLGGLRGISELIDKDDPQLARSIASLIANHGGSFPYSRGKARTHLRVLPEAELLFDASTPLAEIAGLAFQRAGHHLDPTGTRRVMRTG